jgi:hypothetical protein
LQNFLDGIGHFLKISLFAASALAGLNGLRQRQYAGLYGAGRLDGSPATTDRHGNMIDEVRHQSPWSTHKKKKQALGRAGVLGYFFNKIKFQLAPLVVGLILGPNIEKHFREALFLSQGDPWIYVESPIAVAVWLLVAAILIAGFIARRRAAFAEAMAQDSSL